MMIIMMMVIDDDNDDTVDDDDDHENDDDDADNSNADDDNDADLLKVRPLRTATMDTRLLSSNPFANEHHKHSTTHLFAGSHTMHGALLPAGCCPNIRLW